MVINGVEVTADPSLSNEEIVAAVQEESRLWQEQNKTLAAIDLAIDGDSLVVRASEKSPIRRVRRITGYLSSIGQFNDSKLAECTDRRVHTR